MKSRSVMHDNRRDNFLVLAVMTTPDSNNVLLNANDEQLMNKVY